MVYLKTGPVMDLYVPYYCAVAIAVYAFVKNQRIETRKADKGINHPAYPRAHAAKNGRNEVKLKKSNQAPIYRAYNNQRETSPS